MEGQTGKPILACPTIGENPARHWSVLQLGQAPSVLTKSGIMLRDEETSA